MEDGKIDRWVATAGFVSLAAILILVSLAVCRLNIGAMQFQAPVIEWPETIMRILFGKIR